jgi:hypothetical protein
MFGRRTSSYDDAQVHQVEPSVGELVEHVAALWHALRGHLEIIQGLTSKVGELEDELRVFQEEINTLRASMKLRDPRRGAS